MRLHGQQRVHGRAGVRLPDLQRSLLLQSDVGLARAVRRLELRRNFPGGKRSFGVYSEKSWKDFVAALYKGGELKTDNIDVSTLYTNKFAAEYVRFDEAALRKQAAALK